MTEADELEAVWKQFFDGTLDLRRQIDSLNRQMGKARAERDAARAEVEALKHDIERALESIAAEAEAGDAAIAALREIADDHCAFLALAIDKGDPASELRLRVHDIDDKCRAVLDAANTERG